MTLTPTRIACALATAFLLSAPPANALDPTDPQFVRMVRQSCTQGMRAQVGTQVAGSRISSYCDCYSVTVTGIMSGEEINTAMQGGMGGLSSHPKVRQAAQACAAKTLR